MSSSRSNGIESPIVDEVRHRRALISARFGDDLRLYFDHLRQLQEVHKDRVVSQITVVKTGQEDQNAKR